MGIITTRADLEKTVHKMYLEDKNRKDFVNTINSFLDKSFGGNLFKKIRGDRGLDLISYKNPDRSLEDIYIIYPGSRNVFLPFERWIGKFQDQDGSHIEIGPKHAKQAAEYARLYEEKYGKKVKIEINTSGVF